MKSHIPKTGAAGRCAYNGENTCIQMGRAMRGIASSGGDQTERNRLGPLEFHPLFISMSFLSSPASKDGPTRRGTKFQTETLPMADTVFFDPETPASASPAPVQEIDPLDELARLTSEGTQCGQFRIQFLGAGTDRGPTILGDVEVRASDVSTAMREAVHTPWPPRAIGFRIVDHDGREVLGRQEGNRGSR